jgi:hypothetical protein
MKKRLEILVAAVLAVGGIAVIPVLAQDQAGSPQQQQQQQPSAAQGAPAATPSDRAGAGAGAASNAQPAADRPGAAAASESDVRTALAQITQSALDKDQAKNLSQQFSSADQSRLKDFDATGIDQAADQIRQAYKAKYQQDLDLSKNAEMVFSGQFFRIGSLGESARSASERIGAESNAAGGASSTGAASGATGSAQKDAAGVGAAAREGQPAGEAARTASSSSAGGVSVTIPASQGMPETRLNLVRDGSSWKIDLPDNIDGKELSQRLQQHLQMAAQSKDQWPADANEAARAISHHVLAALGSGGSSDSAAPGANTSGGSGAGSGGSTATPGGTRTAR